MFFHRKARILHLPQSARNRVEKIVESGVVSSVLSGHQQSCGSYFWAAVTALTISNAERPMMNSKVDSVYFDILRLGVGHLSFIFFRALSFRLRTSCFRLHCVSADRSADRPTCVLRNGLSPSLRFGEQVSGQARLRSEKRASAGKQLVRASGLSIINRKSTIT